MILGRTAQGRSQSRGRNYAFRQQLLPAWEKSKSHEELIGQLLYEIPGLHFYPYLGNERNTCFFSVMAEGTWAFIVRHEYNKHFCHASTSNGEVTTFCFNTELFTAHTAYPDVFLSHGIFHKHIFGNMNNNNVLLI